MWRSTRREVANELALPPQTSETITLRMTPLERYHYTQYDCWPARAKQMCGRAANFW